MHITEGFLPYEWCIFWYVIAIPVVIYGIYKIRKIVHDFPDSKSLLVVTGAYMFAISSIRIPTPFGSCYHITGNGLNASIFGPVITSVLSVIVLIFHLFFLGDGGITTFGATVVSFGIVGPFVAWGVYRLMINFNISSIIAIFFAAFFGNIFTYAITALQFALAFPEPTFFDAYYKFLILFTPQVAIAVFDGIITVLIWRGLKEYKSKIFSKLKLFGKKESESI